MVELGLVAYQAPVVVDTRSGEPAEFASKRVRRYRTTARGARLVSAAREDIGVLEDLFPRTGSHNLYPVLALVEALNLKDSHARYGLSAQHATLISGLPPSNVKWWLRQLTSKRYIKALPEKLADVREVIPAHWRVTRDLCKQVGDVLAAFPGAPQGLRVEFRLDRQRFLKDIDPRRIGVSGATDFDHDVECQRILAAILRSPGSRPDAPFAVEPRLAVQTDTRARPWRFAQGDDRIYYQPDALLREAQPAGGTAVSVVEYERFQSRRDAWNHVERFLGHIASSTLPFEPAVLRFVVDSKPREKAYVELIEAFADHALDHPELMPANPVQLAVSSVGRVLEADDPLGDATWFRIDLPRRADTAGVPVLHPADDSPYDGYFSRG